MDFWIMINKLALILFMAFSCIIADIKDISWIVFSILLYFCMNITVDIFRIQILKRVMLFCSILFSIVSFVVVHPLFILLLPLSIIELSSDFISTKPIVLIVSLFPIFYINESIQPIYGLVTMFCFMIFTITSLFSKQLVNSESQIDAMRKAIQKLTNNINENNEYIRQSEYTSKLEERNRISQEIHDKIGHSMTGALFQMEAAKRLMNTDKNKATELLQNAINISKDGIEKIRMTLKNMKPPTEQIGIHRMKLFIDEFSSKNDLNTSLTHDGNLDIISPIQWKIIHENVTEALTNAIKYSDASRVSVKMNILNKMIKVEVKDNGKGAGKLKKGLGIIGMEERTASINGKIIVDSKHGFSVTTLLPIL